MFKYHHEKRLSARWVDTFRGDGLGATIFVKNHTRTREGMNYEAEKLGVENLKAFFCVYFFIYNFSAMTDPTIRG